MKITAVTTWFPTKVAPSRGAFVVRDLHAIAKLHDIRAIHLVPHQDDDGTRRLVVEGIDTLRIPMNPRSPLSVARAAKVLTTALAGSDVIHTMAFSSLLPFAPPFRRAVPRDAAWVHTEHWSALSTPESLGSARHFLPLLTSLLQGPDIVTAVCDYLARPIRQARKGRPVDIVPCIVNPHTLHPRRSRSDGSLRLISTGGLIERKDPHTAIRTIECLRARGVKAHLTWLGTGPLLASSKTLSERLGVADYVHFPGTASDTEVRRQLGSHDIFFGPTLADNFFVSAAEAIVAGRPVVLGATGGQREYVAEKVGHLVSQQNPEVYADAILDVDERTRDLTSEEISETIGSRFSSDTVSRDYDSTYMRALASK